MSVAHGGTCFAEGTGVILRCTYKSLPKGRAFFCEGKGMDALAAFPADFGGARRSAPPLHVELFNVLRHDIRGPNFLLLSMFTIGLRYCGGCNPQIDRSRIVTELRASLQKMGVEVDFTSEMDRPVDLVLLVNGCQHACLEGKIPEAGRGHQRISVRGEMVDNQYVEEAAIVKLLIQKVCLFLEESPYI